MGVNISPKRDSSAATSAQITTTWLDQQLSAWQGATPYPLIFSDQFTSASYTNVNNYNTTALDANLNMLYSTGAQAIRIDIGYAPWLQNSQARINEITSVVNNIKAKGDILVIADAASATYQTNPEPWTQFKADWITRVKTLAALYKPDYYIVIKEPGWYAPMVSDATTNSQFQNASDWLALTQQLVDAVQSVSPNTKIGISVAASDMSAQTAFYDALLTGAVKIPGISFIGFDIYSITAFTNTQQFLQQYGSGGKAVWIAEAWSGTANVAIDPSRSSLDTLWIQVLYYFALEIHAQLVSPFFTDLFSSYSTPPTNSQGLITYFQNRTSVFSEYQKIIAQNAATVSTTSQTSSSSSTQSGTSTTITSSSSSSTSSSTSTSSVVTSSSSSTSRIPPSKTPTNLILGVAAIVVLLVVIVSVALVRKRSK